MYYIMLYYNVNDKFIPLPITPLSRYAVFVNSYFVILDNFIPYNQEVEQLCVSLVRSLVTTIFDQLNPVG